jgi:hypothetical protein
MNIQSAKETPSAMHGGEGLFNTWPTALCNLSHYAFFVWLICIENRSVRSWKHYVNQTEHLCTVEAAHWCRVFFLETLIRPRAKRSLLGSRSGRMGWSYCACALHLFLFLFQIHCTSLVSSSAEHCVALVNACFVKEYSVAVHDVCQNLYRHFYRHKSLNLYKCMRHLSCFYIYIRVEMQISS